jgi:hypothetical protein
MKTFTEPAGQNGLKIKTRYYSKRYNHRKTFMSNKPLGWQVLIKYFDDLVWINIDLSWLNK